MKVATIKIGDMVTINGISGFFMGFTPRHGLSKITGYDTAHTIYEGFYNDAGFILDVAFDYGTDNLDLVEYFGKEYSEDIAETIFKFCKDMEPEFIINHRQWVS